MRLGFHYHVPAIQRGSAICMPSYLGRFIDSLAGYCKQVVCYLHYPRSEEISLMDYRVEARNVTLINIGLHASVMKRTFKSRYYTSMLKRSGSELDALLLRGPSPLLPAMATASPVPTALLLVGDYVAGVDDLPQPRWRREAIRLWSHWNKWGQMHAARRSLTFVNSRILFDELTGSVPQLYETRTTTLTAKDFIIRSDTCQSRPVRLLYVGRMDRTKGLLQMVEAVALLAERGEDVVLDLVGWQEHGDTIIEEIDTLAQSKRVGDQIHCLGPRPLGPELFGFYKQADIFVIASFFEGFPRAIWEAMAHSLPVVATCVGSIPAFIHGSAELVLPKDSMALAEAIARLIHRPDLRRMYITRGLELARHNTLEAQTGKMITVMENWLKTRNE